MVSRGTTLETEVSSGARSWEIKCSRAEVERGDGRVIVLGDPELLSSQWLSVTGPWVTDLLRHLTSGRVALPGLEAWRVVVGALLLVSSWGILLVRGRATWAATACALFMLCGFGDPSADSRRFDPPAATVSIDVGHQNEVSVWPGRREGIRGLEQLLRSHGYATQVVADATGPGKGGALILIAPRTAYSEEEATGILRFVEEGGRLLIAAGWEHSDAVEPLLSRVGMRLLPLLVAEPHDHESGHSGELDPTLLRQPYGLVAPTNARVLLESAGVPVAAEVQHGLGRVTAIADPLFLTGGNLIYTGGGFSHHQELVLSTIAQR